MIGKCALSQDYGDFGDYATQPEFQRKEPNSNNVFPTHNLIDLLRLVSENEALLKNG